MTEINTEGRAYATTTTVIDAKNGSISKLSEKTPKKSVADDLAATFSSPAAWLLVVALIFTWSAVAIVMFDLVDYKSYVASYTKYCDDPCLPPGAHQPGLSKAFMEAESPRGDLDHHLKRRGEPPTRKRDSEVLDVSIMKKVEDNKKEDDKDDFLQKKSQKEKLGNSEEIYLDSDKDNMNEIERKEIILHPNKSHNNDGSYISNNGKSVHIDNETKYNKTSIQFSVQGGKRPNLNNSMKNVNRRIRIKDYVEDNFETLRNGRKVEGNEYHHQRNDIKNNCGTDKKTNCFTEEEEQDSNFKKCSKCSHKIVNSSLERFEESLTKTVKANENKSLKRSFIYQNNSTYQNSVHNTSDENTQVDVKEETRILRIKGKKPNYENTKTEEVQDDYTSGNFHVARRTKEIPEKKVKDERKVPAKEVKKVTKEEVKAKKTAIPEKKVEKPKADVKAVEKTKSKGKAKEAESKVVPMKQQIEVPKMKATTQAERPVEKKPTVKPKEDKVKAEKTEIKQAKQEKIAPVEAKPSKTEKKEVKHQQQEKKEGAKPEKKEAGKTEKIEKKEAGKTEKIEKKEARQDKTEKKEGKADKIEKKEAKSEKIEKKEAKQEKTEKKEAKPEKIEKKEAKPEMTEKKEAKPVKKEAKPEKTEKKEAKPEKTEKKEAKPEKPAGKAEVKPEKVEKKEVKPDKIPKKEEMKPEKTEKKDVKLDRIEKKEVKPEKTVKKDDTAARTEKTEKKEAKPGKEEVKLVKAEDKARLHIPRSEAIKAPEEKTKVITEAKKVTTAEPDVAKEKIFAAKKAPEPEKEKISPPKKVTQEKTEEKLSRVKDAEHEKAKPKSPTTPSLKDLPTSKEEKQLLKDRPLSTHHPSIHSASKHTYPEHQPSKMLLSDKTQPQKTDSEKHEKITHSPKAEKVLVPEKKAAPKEGKPKAEDLTTSKQSSTMRYFQCVFVDGNNGYHTGFPFPMLNPNPQSLKRETRAPGH